MVYLEIFAKKHNLRIFSAGDDSQVIEQVNVIRSDLKKALELLNSVDDIINKADRKANTIEETLNQWRLIKGYF